MVASADKYKALTICFKAGLAGDAASYNQFLREIAPLLRKSIGRKIPLSDVEDVLQEVLISLHKARHTYDGQRPLIPWLFAIVGFRINDHLRKLYAGARQETDIDTLSETLADVTEPADSHESLDEWLECIPEREKRILTLMHVEGYTARETGGQLGMNESAVKVAAHRAMKKIREKFGT